MLTTIGFNIRIKGFDILVKSIQSLMDSNRLKNDIIVLVIGISENSEDSNSLRQLIAEAELNRKIMSLGIRNDINDILNISDIYLQPSRTEGLSLSIMEALNYSLPVIGTRVGGIPEIVHEGENGYLFEKENVEELADRIEILVNNREVREMMGRKSKVISSRFTLADGVETVSYTHLYTVRKGLKDVELYKSSPLAVTYRHLDETPVGFTIDISSKETFVISDMEVNGKAFGEDFSGKMGDSIRTEIGTLVINFTKYWNDSFVGTSIRYRKGNVCAVTDYYTAALHAELGNEDATIINLSINDASIQKAEDILNTLIEMYNEKWIQDKNQIAVSTSQLSLIHIFCHSREVGLTAVSAGQGWMRHWTITMSRPWKMTFPKSNRTMNKVMVLLLITWSKSPVRVACSCRRWHRRRTRKRRNACGERRSAGKEGVCEPYV